jgi:hypothetical protein
MKSQTTYFYHSRRAAPKSAAWVSRAKQAIGCVLGKLSIGVSRCRTPGVPTTFNDRMLADIGLTRDQIESEPMGRNPGAP